MDSKKVILGRSLPRDRLRTHTHTQTHIRTALPV